MHNVAARVDLIDKRLPAPECHETPSRMSIITRRTFVAGAVAGCVSSYGLMGPQALAAKPDPAGKLRVGVNLAGAEFKAIGGKWHWPNPTNTEYYLEKGFNIFRVPFIWGRLQPKLSGPLDETAMLGLDQMVRRITSAGAVIVLDAHNYGRRDGVEIGRAGSPVSLATFAAFWGRMARRYRSNDLVWYNLMNEPHDQDAMLNLAVQNAACAAIRQSGARSKVLFSGSGWSSARSWVSSTNGRIMLGARDVGNNFAFDIHQYLGKAHLGYELNKLPGVGERIMSRVYDWAHEHKKHLFLGEFSISKDPLSMGEVDAMLKYMSEHSDVFVGATYFAGGGTWGRNPASSDPIGGIDKPQTEMMRKYL